MKEIEVPRDGNYREGNEHSPNTLVTFTAKDIALKLGVSDRTVGQRWIPQLEELFFWCKADLRKGARFTWFCYEECGKLQTAISPRIPKRNLNGEILCDGEGKVLTQKNPNRVGFEVYKQQVWDKHGEYDDDVPYVDDAAEVLTLELVEEYTEAINTIDTTSSSINNAFIQAKISGAALGQQIANIAMVEAAKTFQEAFSSGLNAMTTAMDTKPTDNQKRTRKRKKSSPCRDDG